MNQLIEFAPTKIRDRSGEFALDAGSVRKHPGFYQGKRRASITVQNLAASGSANVVQLRTNLGTVVHTVLATESKQFSTDEDFEISAPAANSAAVVCDILELEYTSRGSIGATAGAPASSAPAGGSTAGGGTPSSPSVGRNRE